VAHGGPQQPQSAGGQGHGGGEIRNATPNTPPPPTKTHTPPPLHPPPPPPTPQPGDGRHGPPRAARRTRDDRSGERGGSPLRAHLAKPTPHPPRAWGGSLTSTNHPKDFWGPSTYPIGSPQPGPRERGHAGGYPITTPLAPTDGRRPPGPKRTQRDPASAGHRAPPPAPTPPARAPAACLGRLGSPRPDPRSPQSLARRPKPRPRDSSWPDPAPRSIVASSGPNGDNTTPKTLHVNFLGLHTPYLVGSAQSPPGPRHSGSPQHPRGYTLP